MKEDDIWEHYRKNAFTETFNKHKVMNKMTPDENKFNKSYNHNDLQMIESYLLRESIIEFNKKLSPHLQKDFYQILNDLEKEFDGEYNDGLRDGIEEGYSKGYEEAENDTANEIEVSYEKGRAEGYEDAEYEMKDKIKDSYDEGYTKGKNDTLKKFKIEVEGE